MKEPLLNLLACPECKGPLLSADETGGGEGIDSAKLRCTACERTYPVRDGIPRFVAEHNYADSFGFQWNRFSRTQLDSHSGVPISRERLLGSTGWDWPAIRGKRVLDVGCGAGRFAEVALEFGANVVAVDYSSAIDAARSNLARFPQFEGIQASVYNLPFVPGSFDYVYCLGVLQHTPDPDSAFAKLPEQLRNGGRIAIDVYPLMWANIFWSKYWLRPLTKRIPGEKLFAMLEGTAPGLLALSRRVGAIPLVGRKLKYLLPVANYDHVYALSETQLREWAVLDTFDMLSPQHDHPKSSAHVRDWLQRAGLTEIE